MCTIQTTGQGSPIVSSGHYAASTLLTIAKSVPNKLSDTSEAAIWGGSKTLVKSLFLDTNVSKQYNLLTRYHPHHFESTSLTDLILSECTVHQCSPRMSTLQGGASQPGVVIGQVVRCLWRTHTRCNEPRQSSMPSENRLQHEHTVQGDECVSVRGIELGALSWCIHQVLPAT